MRLSLTRAAAIGVIVVGLAPLTAPAGDPGPPPRTGFEIRGGASWTTYQEEVRFLEAVDARSERVAVEVIGKSTEGKPMHLVRIGDPRPRALEAARTLPVQLNMCTQHGNEPAGREACLRWLRDLAFTNDPTLVAQMRDQTILFVPTANPDGRDANTRGNADGTDVNRDHLNVETPEARAIGAVVRDWRPSFVLDYHEYGPSEPVLYDDDILYLWPRNLNVDPAIREIGKRFSQEHLRPCLADAGYSSDEYGLEAVGDIDVEQTAGDEDEGIARNAAGLRHAVGILVESATSPKLTSPIEVIDGAANANRRVDSQHKVIDCALAFSRTDGAAMRSASEASRGRGAGIAGAAPDSVYFDGQDEDTTLTGSRDEPTMVADAPCGYELSTLAYSNVTAALDVHGIRSSALGANRLVRLAQDARPVIPLLLDARGARNSVNGKALSACPAAPVPVPALPPVTVRVKSGRLPASGVGTSTLRALGLLVAAGLVAALRGRSRRIG
jgi:zinc carboxypeptidase